jgi:hypothetical protein
MNSSNAPTLRSLQIGPSFIIFVSESLSLCSSLISDDVNKKKDKEYVRYALM